MLKLERIKQQLRTVTARLEWVWLDTANQIRSAKIPLVASSLAYTTILSVVPMLAVSLAIFQAFGGLDKLSTLIRPLVIQYLAEAASEEAMQMIEGFIANIHAGALGATGLIGLIATTMIMLSSAEQAINDVWQAKITRSLFQRAASYWFFITLGPLAAAIALGAYSSYEGNLPAILPSGAAAFTGSAVVFFGVYKWVPNRHVNWIPALAGALFTAVFLSLARGLYALYTSEIVAYNRIYGSLGAIPIILVWIYIIWMIILTGAALGAAIQRKFDLR